MDLPTKIFEKGVSYFKEYNKKWKLVQGFDDPYQNAMIPGFDQYVRGVGSDNMGFVQQRYVCLPVFSLFFIIILSLQLHLRP